MTNEPTKECNKCHEIKPLLDFYKHKRTSDGYEHTCKECKRADSAARRKERKEMGRCHCGRPLAEGYKTCKIHVRNSTKWNRIDPEKKREYAATYLDNVKDEVFGHYGNRCACCGESRRPFLTIDHINGGGNKHRRELGIYGGVSFYLWLRKNTYPEGFRLLCYNCNLSRGQEPCCHEKEPRLVLTSYTKSGNWWRMGFSWAERS